MTQAAVLPVVFDQASPALPTGLAASRVVSHPRTTRPASPRNDITMADHRQLPSQPLAVTAQRSDACHGTHAASSA
ncbi:hypothetical protein BRM22_12505 [Xanthomonas oryzae pv. oryzae]|nr:hypothetical protein B9W05_12135 [Xanthomonas oryzae pv. oryzae]AXI22506.1 hypothetical protein CDO11_17930 [Xanthomonas oryzae pv. oryzae]AXM10665.1 hypothetical protein BRM60_17830 [Xanthomonas oryzae pv. oryzae]AXM14402.1 hypothetical protein BRN32_18010 [Xanthomonas oryzae pv. oryzae]AXM18116.1 hypothetical protein BRN66_17530 [Xanthomonas oryzae pv. oryzae]